MCSRKLLLGCLVFLALGLGVVLVGLVLAVWLVPDLDKQIPPVIITILPPFVPVITKVAPPPASSGLLPCGTRSAPALVMVSPANQSWYPIRDASGISQYKVVLTNKDKTDQRVLHLKHFV
jgi:hypothetical protein